LCLLFFILPPPAFGLSLLSGSLPSAVSVGVFLLFAYLSVLPFLVVAMPVVVLLIFCRSSLFLAGFFIRPGPEDPDPQQWILQKKIFLSVFFTFTLPTKVT